MWKVHMVLLLWAALLWGFAVDTSNQPPAYQPRVDVAGVWG